MKAKILFCTRLALALVFGYLVACGLASADQIIATGVDSNLGESFWIQENGQDTSVYFGGVIDITLISGGQKYDRDTLCVDLFTDIYIGQTYDTTVLRPDQASLMTGKDLERVSWLVDNVLLPAQDPSYTSQLAPQDWLVSPSPAQGAGLQLAIWDITVDGGDGFSSGSVQAVTNTDPQVLAGTAAPTDPAVLAWANPYLELSAGKSSDLAFVYDNFAPGSGQPAQMLEGPKFADGGPVPAPEPSSFAMVGGVLIALAALVRTR